MKRRKQKPAWVRYEKQKSRAHKARHVGGPRKEDARKRKQKIEIKDWKKPVPKPVVVKAWKRGVRKFISKGGFYKPALKFGKTKRMKLYKGKKRVA